jgi:hypothetical protein
VDQKKRIVKEGVLNKIMSAVQRGIVKQEFAMQLWSSIGDTGAVTFFFFGINDTQVCFM